MREGSSNRRGIAGAVVFLVACTLSAPATADDTTYDSASLASLLRTPTVAGYQYEAHGRTLASDYVDMSASMLASLDFRDGSTLGRLRRIRQLSLLTIAENGKSRVYLGVNDEGIFGIHLAFLPQRQSDRFAEVLRMPYLRVSDNN